MRSGKGWLANGTDCTFAEVCHPLPGIPECFSRHNTRNNRLLLAALEPIEEQVRRCISDFGPLRVAVILGSSTSGIYEGELALRHWHKTGVLPEAYAYEQQEPGDTARFLAAYLGVQGPVYTISTACSSSARAMISGRRLLQAGAVDAVIAGGSDSLCHLTLNGFNSLQALSPRRCRPFSLGRDGITIGEAAGLFLLTREKAEVALLGAGESSDAYHMSAPLPDGSGAERAMRLALADADVKPEAVGYINLHGTGTRLNDSMESAAVWRVFGGDTPCSSSKHLTGHTLGSCGATEAALCHMLLSLPGATLPWQDFSESPRDPELPEINIISSAGASLKRPLILSNSFAFGGNNAALILAAGEEYS